MPTFRAETTDLSISSSRLSREKPGYSSDTVRCLGTELLGRLIYRPAVWPESVSSLCFI